MTTQVDNLPVNYRFADLTLDVARRCVTRQGQTIELKALDFDLLRFLVEQSPNVVNADVLAEKVWGRHFVSPENVAQRVMLLRQSLSDDANKPRYIETVRNKGYRLIPIAERVPTASLPATSRRRGWRVALIPATLLAAFGVTATLHWPPAPGRTSVAVLPFDNSSPDADHSYFAAGMQPEIVNQLAKIDGLRVFPIGLTDGTQRPLTEVLRDLDVATVLRGSVHHADGRVRVNIQLTETATSEILWSDSDEREFRDFFAIQSGIALNVARALRVELSSAERTSIQRVPTVSLHARDLYLRALARNWRSEEVLLAIEELKQALELDAEFKEAWAAYSIVRNYAQAVDAPGRDEHRLHGEDAARRALRLDPEFGAGYQALGYSLLTQNNWNEAEAAFAKAEALGVPLSGMGSYAFLQLSAGKFGPLARNIFEEARGAEPNNALYYRFLVFVYEGLGDGERANDVYESALRAFPHDSREVLQMHAIRMHWLIGRGRLEEARAIPTSDPLNAAMVASLDAAPERAIAELRSAYATTAANDQIRNRDIALWAGYFGDTELALEAMRATINQGGGLIAYIWLPQLAQMRQLPEFKSYMREIGMVAYWKEYDLPASCRWAGKDDFDCD